MKYILLLIFLGFFSLSIGQVIPKEYEDAYEEIHAMLSGELPINFKRAVFLVENAWHDNELSYYTFEANINYLNKNAQILFNSQKDVLEDTILVKNWAVYSVLMDTINQRIFNQEDTVFSYIKPFAYDFVDFAGKNDWSKMFVSKLLYSSLGNCHSLPFLYKILADEIGTIAHVALAPNHFYIKQNTISTGWYNTELTSNSFPIDAWIMSSGNITLEAIQNGLYLRALSEKEMITLCLVDLAQGYERKYTSYNPEFVLKCTELALKYNTNYINALLLKAETLKYKLDKSISYGNELYSVNLNEAKFETSLFDKMQEIYLHIYDLGYRSINDEAYLKWLADSRKEEYQNKRLSNFNVQSKSIKK